MTQRRSIDVDGLSHGPNPVPAAAVVRGLLCTGGISGVDRRTGRLPDDPGDEVRAMFDNLEAVLEAAGGGLDDAVRLDVTLREPQLRELLNAEWLRRFPDAGARPARKVTMGDLPPGLAIQCLTIAVLPEAGDAPAPSAGEAPGSSAGG